jgi:hypothetical protein
MKTYIVYVDGIDVGYIEAENRNSAYKKAKDKYPNNNVTVWLHGSFLKQYEKLYALEAFASPTFH